MVFETTDPAFKWDGSYQNMKENSAVFTYYLEAVLHSGEKINRKGNISLVR
jgi:hypothetical protein